MAITAQFSRAKILIVDDNPTILLLLDKMLKSEGYTDITLISDSREIEAAYLEKHFDIVLLNLHMPHLDSLAVMARLQQVGQESYLPILALTTQPDSATRLWALEAGAKDFLNRPFERMEVLNRIRNMLEMRFLNNQLSDQNMILEQKVEERTRELRDTRFEIILRLGRAVEYRDNETGLHCIRMSRFSECLGRSLGMTADESEMLLNASLMHDIGKIGIPDRILLKPGKLDPEEWEIMKTHAMIGAQILSGYPSPLIFYKGAVSS